MFNFSTNTLINKTFKMSDLDKQIEASKECKEDEKIIESVTLKNIISPKTLNSNVDKEIKEIYIFEIIVKERYIPEIFIRELDKNIKLMTLFLIRHEDYECGVIAYKKDKFKDKYYATNWENRTDYDIPLGSSVSGCYKFILSKFLEYLPFEKESVDMYYKRNNQLKKLDFQIDKTQKAIRYETQSKKRFEYNDRLKEYIEERKSLLEEGK